MKKLSWAAIAVIMLAAPAPAGLTPESLNPAELHPAVSRSATYAPNDAGHVYDMMSATYQGPEDVRYLITSETASGAFCHLIHLRPGATSISSIHMPIDLRLVAGSGGAPWTFSIAFRNDNGPGPSPIGSFLTTQASGFSAWYIIGGMPAGTGIDLFRFDLGAFAANVTQTNVWACVQANRNFRLTVGGRHGNEQHGNPGNGTPTSHYIGTSSDVYASSFGVGIGSASLMSSFTFAGAVIPPVGSLHMALGGVPEPATIGLIGLAVLVLRRRKA